MATRPRSALASTWCRALAMDAVQRANSGHPGTPMALAPLADVLWTRVMKYDAADPDWPDRDRFVLSAGHASMLLYSMLYLTGFGLELDDLREFRQWGSRTPGHPEYRHTKGVEVTTGPLGQGFGDAVGIAIAEKHLRARFGPEVCDHHVFGICSDGDLMEGISHEAASLAGHLQLGRLVFVYDDNHITIDGDTALAYSDDVPEALRGVRLARRAARRGGRRPRRARGRAARRRWPRTAGRRSSCCARTSATRRRRCRTPRPRTATRSAPTRSRASRRSSGCPPEDFYVPDDVLARYRAAGRARRRGARRVGRTRRDAWLAANPARADEYEACLTGPPARRLGAEAADVRGRHADRDARRDQGRAHRGRRPRARA